MDYKNFLSSLERAKSTEASFDFQESSNVIPKIKKALEERARNLKRIELKNKYLLSKSRAENLAKTLGYSRDYVENILNLQSQSNSTEAYQKGVAAAGQFQNDLRDAYGQLGAAAVDLSRGMGALGRHVG